MIFTNRYEIGFRIPDDLEILNKFEEENDLSDWIRRETTEYITYIYITVHYEKGANSSRYHFGKR